MAKDILIMNEIIKAIKNIFLEKRSIVLFPAIAVGMFILMFLIPVYSIPGNTVKFQSVLFQPKDYALLTTLSVLSALVLTIQINLIIQKNKINRGASVLNGVGIFFGIFSSIFASATCGMCVAALFSFLGFGTVLFLINSRWYILLISAGLLLLSLYFSSRRYNRGCELCIIKES